jgi:hypothetical protein
MPSRWMERAAINEIVAKTKEKKYCVRDIPNKFR